MGLRDLAEKGEENAKARSAAYFRLDDIAADLERVCEAAPPEYFREFEPVMLSPPEIISYLAHLRKKIPVLNKYCGSAEKELKEELESVAEIPLYERCRYAEKSSAPPSAPEGPITKFCWKVWLRVEARRQSCALFTRQKLS